MKNRVVITGMGVVAPNALNVDEFRKALQEENPVLSDTKTWVKSTSSVNWEETSGDSGV